MRQCGLEGRLNVQVGDLIELRGDFDRADAAELRGDIDRPGEGIHGEDQVVGYVVDFSRTRVRLSNFRHPVESSKERGLLVRAFTKDLPGEEVEKAYREYALPLNVFDSYRIIRPLEVKKAKQEE